jgi:hypothetical protein
MAYVQRMYARPKAAMRITEAFATNANRGANSPSVFVA